MEGLRRRAGHAHNTPASPIYRGPICALGHEPGTETMLISQVKIVGCKVNAWRRPRAHSPAEIVSQPQPRVKGYL